MTTPDAEEVTTHDAGAGSRGAPPVHDKARTGIPPPAYRDGFAHSDRFYEPGSTPHWPPNVCTVCFRVHERVMAVVECEHRKGRPPVEWSLSAEEWLKAFDGWQPRNDDRLSPDEDTTLHDGDSQGQAEAIDGGERFSKAARRSYLRIDAKARRPPKPAARRSAQAGRAKHRVGAPTPTPARPEGGSASASAGHEIAGEGDSEPPPPDRMESAGNATGPFYSAMYVSVGEERARAEARDRILAILSRLVRKA